MAPNRKSQSAVEYIQTYSWAILIVLVVGIAIWQMGILGRDKTNVASGFTVIQVVQNSIKYTASESRENNFTFTIMNAGNIRVDTLYSNNISGDCSNITLDYRDGNYNTKAGCEFEGGEWIECGGSPCTCILKNPVELDPGDRWVAPLYTDCEPLLRGEPFEVHISFSYRERVGRDWIEKKDVGIIRGYAE